MLMIVRGDPNLHGLTGKTAIGKGHNEGGTRAQNTTYLDEHLNRVGEILNRNGTDRSIERGRTASP